MEDRQVFTVVNRNHQCQAILDRIVIDLDICALKAGLDAISARRRNRKCTELAHIVEQTWTRVNRATAWMKKTLTQIK